MNLPRSSILRLMLVIALVAGILVLFRKDARGFWAARELAAPLSIGLGGIGAGLLACGPMRRFFLASGITGILIGTTFWLAPVSPVRHFLLWNVILTWGDRLGLVELDQTYRMIFVHGVCSIKSTAAIGRSASSGLSLHPNLRPCLV